MGILKKKPELKQEEVPEPPAEILAAIRVGADMDELKERFDRLEEKHTMIENVYQDFMEFRNSMTQFSKQEFTPEQKEILKQIEANITFNLDEYIKKTRDVEEKVNKDISEIEELYDEKPMPNYKGAAQIGYHTLKSVSVLFDKNEDTLKVLTEQINNLENVFKAIV